MSKKTFILKIIPLITIFTSCNSLKFYGQWYYRDGYVNHYVKITSKQATISFHGCRGGSMKTTAYHIKKDTIYIDGDSRYFLHKNKLHIHCPKFINDISKSRFQLNRVLFGNKKMKEHLNRLNNSEY